MRDHAKVLLTLWASQKFAAIGTREIMQDVPPVDVLVARLVYFYIITCPHRTSVGCFRFKMGYMTTDLDMAATAIVAALKRLSDVGLIAVDQSESLVYIEGWIEAYLPSSPNHCKKMIYDICPLPEGEFKLRVARDLLEAMIVKGWTSEIDLLKGCVRSSEDLLKTFGRSDPPHQTSPHQTQQLQEGVFREENGQDFNKNSDSSQAEDVPRETSTATGPPIAERRRLYREFPHIDSADDFAQKLPSAWRAVWEKFYQGIDNFEAFRYAAAVEFWDKYVGLYPGDMVADGYPEKANWLWCWEFYVESKHAKWKKLPPPVRNGHGQMAANRRKFGEQ